MLGNLEGFTPGEPVARTQADAWIFSRLARLSKVVTDGDFRIPVRRGCARAAQLLLERVLRLVHRVSKASLRAEGEERLQTQRNLVFVLDNALRLLHPAMPFVTEAIWEHLPKAEGEKPALMVAAWPEPETLASLIDPEAERAVGMLCGVVGAVRSTRARYGISPKQELAVVVNAQPENVTVLEELSSQISVMARVSGLAVAAGAPKPAESAAVVVEGAEVYSVLTGMVDFDAERTRLAKEQKKLAGDAAKFSKKLSNPGFLAKGCSRDRGEGPRQARRD